MAMTEEERKEYNRRWRREHPERCKAYRTEYKIKNKEKIAKYARDYYHKRMEDPDFRNKQHEYYAAYYKNHKEIICGKIDYNYRKKYLRNYEKLRIWYGHCPYTLLQQYKLKCKNNAFVAEIPFDVYLAMSACYEKNEKIYLMWDFGKQRKTIEEIKAEIENFGFDFEDETFKYMIKCLNESHGKLDFLRKFLENPELVNFKNTGRKLIYLEDFIPGKKRNPEIIYSKEVNNGQ